MANILKFSAIFMGVSSSVSQIILIREFLIVFSGNEFYIGILLSNWLLFEAIGSYFSGKLIKKTVQVYISITILFSLTLFLSLFSVRLLKYFFQISIAEPVSFSFAYASSFFNLFIVSGLHGALFPLTCEMFNQFCKSKKLISGEIYAYESIGTVIGGILVTYVFISLFDSFKTILVISLINSLICIVIVLKILKIKKWLVFLCIMAFFFIVCLVFYSGKLHMFSIKKQWRNLNIVAYINSKYGNICVVENQGQYVFFQDGEPTAFIPYPDMVAVEEFVHIPLLTHRNPKHVLLIGIGPGGPISEILKHPTIEEIEYLEIDPLLIRLFESFKTSLTEKELESPKLKIKYQDGRRYIKETPLRYDIIMVGIKTPSSLQANRFFTQEFFSLSMAKLNEDGILVISTPFSLRKTNKELQELAKAVFSTLKSNFNFIRIIPGEGSLLYLCSNSESVLKIEKNTLLEEIYKRNLPISIDMPWYIESKLHSGWEKWFNTIILADREYINADFRPLAVFYTISYLQIILNPSISKIFEFIKNISYQTILIILLSSFLVYFILGLFRKRQIPSLITIPILFTGFYGMVIELIILFSFQSIFGYLYSWIGILFSAYMAGSALGAFLGSTEKIKEIFSLKAFALTELCLIILSFFCPEVIGMAKSASPVALKVIFVFLSIMAGFLVSVEFPLANLIYVERAGEVTKVAALIYAFDLLGGFIAGLMSGLWLLPLLGLKQSCQMLTIMKALTIALFLVEFFCKEKKDGL